jgi:hypothetical protein
MGLSGIGGVVAAAGILAGCAAIGVHGLEPGRSTEADVRRALGEPALALDGPGGTRSLAYPGGPGGTRTWMARLGPDGRLVQLEDALTDDSRSRVTPGITKEEVLRLIGPPWRTMDFPNKRQVAWDYRVRDTWGYLVDYSVMIDERGRVAETVAARLDDGHDEAK